MKRTKGLILLFIITIVTSLTARADEGMWTLFNLPDGIYQKMQQDGLTVNPDSLKQCVVNFSGYCTGEVVSPNGLVLTNHHCGFSAINELSTVEHDYMRDGFVALEQKDELPASGVFVAFMINQFDVTQKLDSAGFNALSPFDQDLLLDSLETALTDEAKKIDSTYYVEIKPFYEGNAYYAATFQTYYDVRLVFAPTKSMGKFGGETDNWMWPRQTCDISVFRVYADPVTGGPAPYSEKNVPMRPKHWLEVSTNGYKDGDFAMIMGYPGSTERYLSSYGIQEMRDCINDPRQQVRGIKQDVMKKHMDRDQTVRLKYETKYAHSANYWKNAIGMNKCIDSIGIIRMKQQMEQRLMRAKDSLQCRYDFLLHAKDSLQSAKGSLLRTKDSLQGAKDSLSSAHGTTLLTADSIIIAESLQHIDSLLCADSLQNIDALRLDDRLDIKKLEAFYAARREAMYTYTLFKETFTNQSHNELAIRANMYFNGMAVHGPKNNSRRQYNKFYDNSDTWDRDLDCEALAALIKNYREKSTWELPSFYKTIDEQFGGDYQRYVETMWDNSLLMKNGARIPIRQTKKTKMDLGIQFSESLAETLADIKLVVDSLSDSIKAQEKYLCAAKIRMEQDMPHYSDANFTLRMSYGRVRGYKLGGYDSGYYTTAASMYDKMLLGGDIEDYYVEPQVRDYINRKTFGIFNDAETGTLNLCFLTNNDITGGNSGSPVLDRNGRLIGLAFDGNWDSLSSDIFYDSTLARTINVDIRYILYIMKSWGKADRLLHEMGIE